jgi:N-methylhydantoinase B
VKALTNPELPANEGFNRPVKVIAPQGSIFNANPGVPSFLSGNVAQTILELINRAMYKVLPNRIPACSGGDVIGNGFFGVDEETGNYWGTITPSIIGQGADFSSDGDSYLMFHAAGASQNIPTEILESTFPLFVEKVELIQDSGGPGKQRGGLGSRIEIRLLKPAMFYSFIEKGKSPHWGFNQGKPGLRNYATIEPEHGNKYEVLKTSGVPLTEGDKVAITAGGGGGYGNSMERDIEKVRMDVINGYISIEQAKQDYGVFIDPTTYEVDIKRTQAFREKR